MKVDGDPDPTDASSSGAGKVDQNPPNYGEFFDVVGKVYTNQQGSNKQLIQQLGAHQRYVHITKPKNPQYVAAA